MDVAAVCTTAGGGQSSCNRPAPPGVRTGLIVSTDTYEGQDPPLLPGMPPRSFVKTNGGAFNRPVLWTGGCWCVVVASMSATAGLAVVCRVAWVKQG